MANRMVHLKLMVDGHELEAAVELPANPSPRRVLLPILRNLTDAVVAIAVGASAEPVSCQKGCDACCRQMVPISAAEAHGLAAMIAEMPAEEAGVILERFEEACRVLEERSVMERLERRHELTLAEAAELDRDYFLAGIACPFLVDHACSIHPSRPLACREFLVTSDALHCADPSADFVRQLPLSAKVSVALSEYDEVPWVPLVLARRYVAEHAEEVPADLPAKILDQILKAL